MEIRRLNRTGGGVNIGKGYGYATAAAICYQTQLRNTMRRRETMRTGRFVFTHAHILWSSLGRGWLRGNTHTFHILNNALSSHHRIMSVSYAANKLRVPPGFEHLLEGLAREILREQPKNLVEFSAQYFRKKLQERDGASRDTCMGRIFGRGGSQDCVHTLCIMLWCVTGGVTEAKDQTAQTATQVTPSEPVGVTLSGSITHSQYTILLCR